MASYRAAIRLVPNDAEAHKGLGDALMDMGLQDEAVRPFRRACQAHPGSASCTAICFIVCTCTRTATPEPWLRNTTAGTNSTRNPWPRISSRMPTIRTRTDASASATCPDTSATTLSAFLSCPCLQPTTAKTLRSAATFRRAPDDLTLRLRGLCDRWHDLATDRRGLADLVRHDLIDILVDLRSHGRQPLVDLRPQARPRAGHLPGVLLHDGTADHGLSPDRSIPRSRWSSRGSTRKIRLAPRPTGAMSPLRDAAGGSAAGSRAAAM